MSIVSEVKTNLEKYFLQLIFNRHLQFQVALVIGQVLICQKCYLQDCYLADCHLAYFHLATWHLASGIWLVAFG